VQIFPTGSMHIYGTLQDGKQIEYSLDAGSTKGSDLVGLVEPKVDPLLTDEEVPPERFVKAVLTSGEYLMCHVNGFITKYFVLDAEIARDLFCQHSAEDVLDVASVRSLRSTASARANAGNPGAEQTQLHSCGDINLHLDQASDTDLSVWRRALAAYIFRSIDTNSDGRLSVEELREALLGNAEFLALMSDSGRKPRVEDLVGAIDTNDDGWVSLDEFCTFFSDGMFIPARGRARTAPAWSFASEQSSPPFGRPNVAPQPLPKRRTLA